MKLVTKNRQSVLSVRRGMTLIEMLTVLAVVSLILIAIADSILALHKTNNASLASIQEVGAARASMKAIADSLREAGYGDDGSYPIISMAPSSLVFFSTIPQGNGAQKIQYVLSNTTLTQNITLPGAPPTYSGGVSGSSIAEYVSNNADSAALFRYFDASGVEITDMNRVRDVRSITISVHVVVGGANAPFILTSSVTPRIFIHI